MLRDLQGEHMKQEPQQRPSTWARLKRLLFVGQPTPAPQVDARVKPAVQNTGATTQPSSAQGLKLRPASRAYADTSSSDTGTLNNLMLMQAAQSSTFNQPPVSAHHNHGQAYDSSTACAPSHHAHQPSTPIDTGSTGVTDHSSGTTHTVPDSSPCYTPSDFGSSGSSGFDSGPSW